MNKKIVSIPLRIQGICIKTVPLILSMKKYQNLSVPITLRNGKIVASKKCSIKKKCTPTIKSDLTNVHIKCEDNSQDIVTTSYEQLLDNHQLYFLLHKFPPTPIINSVPIDYQNNNHKNGYTNLEDYIQLNEVQIYNALEPKLETNSKLIIKKKTKRTVIPSKPLNKKNCIKTENYNLVASNNTDARITRGKTIKLQKEERKQLDQMMFDKFPNNTFKMFAIQLDDITEEVKFLKKLGLTCRFKCCLNKTCKVKKKT